MKPLPPIDIVLDDQNAERVRRNHEERLKQLAGRPAFVLTPIGEVTLPDGTEVIVQHKLGRAPVQVIIGPTRGAVTPGRIEEVRSSSRDRTKVIILRADDMGATVKVDVTVL